MASGGHFSYELVRWRGFPGPPAGKWLPEAIFWYRFVRLRDLPGPLAGKWLLEATFRIDLYAGGASLGHLLGNGFQNFYLHGSPSLCFLGSCALPAKHLQKHSPEMAFLF